MARITRVIERITRVIERITRVIERITRVMRSITRVFSELFRPNPPFFGSFAGKYIDLIVHIFLSILFIYHFWPKGR
jgi:hypothetical protein